MIWKIDGILERLGLVKEKTIGVAFSGGGAKGFSHIGVIRALEEFGFRPDIISGVSAGSIAAALYGAGLSTDDMIKCFEESDSFGDFTEWSIPKNGFMKLTRFGKLLESWLPVKRLEDMKIPTVICATDIDHGKSVGWSKGEIVPRVLASCSIPIVFNPVVINGVRYVDGGVLRNLPAWAIRKHCEVLIGSNCAPMRNRAEKGSSVIDIAERTFRLMMKANVPQDVRLCDHVINISSMHSVSTFDLKSLHRGVTEGYDAACRKLESILKADPQEKIQTKRKR